MTTFAAIHRALMDIYCDKIEPMRTAGPIGALWTSRLELAGIIARIDEWIETQAADMFEIQHARELRAFFALNPEAGYSFDECRAALKAETLKWTGGKNRYKRGAA